MSNDLPGTPDDESADAEHEFIDDGVLYDDEVTPEYGILGFTLRELLIVGVWAVAFLVSFFPLGWSPSLWAQGVSWILPIGVPTAAVFLLVLRRFSPDGIRRVGSLGIDQFASVAFSVAVIWWVQQLWQYVSVLISIGSDDIVWVPWVQLVLSVALVKLTVFAPIIPGLKEDFQGRLVTLAHRNANPVRPVIARPRSEAPAPAPAAEPEADDFAASGIVLADAAPAASAGEPAAVPASSEPTAVPATSGSTAAPATSGSTAVPASSEPAAAPAPSEPTVETVAPVSGSWSSAEAIPADDAVTTRFPELDVELSDLETTDQFARGDLAPQVGLSAHASGGGTGTEPAASDEEYTPSYSRRSRNAEIVSDTDSIIALVTPEPPDDDHAAPALDAETPASFAPRGDELDVEATNPREAIIEAQPFWILASTERDVHDERGDVLFRIGPTAWALVIEDRGGAYVVRHDDGRIGYLHDITDITRG